MSGSFVAANTVWLNNTAPKITDYPFSVGCWVQLTAASTVVRNIFALTDTGTANNYLALIMLSTERLGVSACAGGTASNATAASAITAGQWNYVVGRFISTTLRRTSVYFHTGNILHGTVEGTVRAPTGMDSVQIGHLVGSAEVDTPWDGRIAELWYASGDLQANSASATDEYLLRRLAFQGPFSVPHLAGKIIEYLPFRSAVPTGDRYSEPDYYFAGMPRPTWAVGTSDLVTLAPHPPLPYYHRSPWERSSLLTV